MTNPELVLAAQTWARNRKSKLLLSNVEFIALKMQAHPGQSGRFYRRALSFYRDPAGMAQNPTHASENHAPYFLKPLHSVFADRYYKYPGRLWVDRAADSIRKGGVWGRFGEPCAPEMRPARSEWHLTKDGWNKANVARVKLGLDPIPFPG